MHLPSHVSETIKRLNPAVFGMGALPDPKRKPDQRRKSQDRQLEEGEASVGFRIVIISCRSRMADIHDNLRQGAKPLVDAICHSLGFASDSDPRLQWEYRQITGKPYGTIVLIERV